MQDFFNNFFDRPYRTLQYPSKNYGKSIEVNSDSYSLLLRKFLKGVATKMIDIVVKEKHIPEEEALDFIEYMLSSDDNRKNKVHELVEKCYKEGNSKSECAKILLDNFYKITKINVYKDSSEQEEIIEVTESLNNEIIKPTASLSLLINFISRLNDLKIKFILDTKYINGIVNSLNTKDYLFYVETKPINNKEVEFEFKYSKALSKILTSFDKYKEMTNEISFYIGIDKNNFLHFGYIITDKRIKIGTVKYKTQDIQKISQMIESTNKDIDMNILSQRFLSTLSLIQYYKNVFNEYLQSYEDDIEIYTTIIDNKFVVVIESIDHDIINKKYLDNIVSNNKFIKRPFHYEWEIKTTIINKKLYFYFTINK